MKHPRAPNEDRGFRALRMQLTGPHPVAENHEGKEVTYAIVAVLRF